MFKSRLKYCATSKRFVKLVFKIVLVLLVTLPAYYGVFYHRAVEADSRESLVSPSDVLILGYMRGGSKLLGEIIGHKENIFYFYEPLWKLAPFGYMKNGKECSIIYNNCSSSSKYVLAKKLLLDIYNCNFTALGQYIYPWLHINYGRPDWKVISKCNSTFPGCFGHLEEMCRNSIARVVKVIRLTVQDVKFILKARPNVRIIHLLRDPRAIVHSRNRSFPHTFNDSRLSAASICQKMLHDYQAALFIQREYPDRLLTIFYESLAEHFDKTIKRLFDFLNFRYTVSDRERLLPFKCAKCVTKEQRNLVENIWNTFRLDSFETSFRWRETISINLVRLVDSLCKDMYDVTGYKTITDTKELRNVSRSLLVD